MSEHEIIAKEFTAKQGKERKNNELSEREQIIKQFKEGKIQVLVAMKCLDEGIDIPSADIALLMSSTTNPREYIQRIGRVIRQYEGKMFAKIYDFVCLSKDEEFKKDIFDKEKKRFDYIADNATNSTESINLLYGMQGDKYGDK
ncbi:MAG: helicase-related protein [Bacilli bacterium]